MDLARLSAEGKRTDTLQKTYPEIAQAYGDYLLARTVSLVPVSIEKEKSKRLVLVNYTTGLAHLPVEGGVMDQPYKLMKLWSFFMEGDQIATRKSLS